MKTWRKERSPITDCREPEPGKVKPVKLTTFIQWPPTDVGHISVEPAKSYIVGIYDHLRNFSTFIRGLEL